MECSSITFSSHTQLVDFRIVHVSFRDAFAKVLNVTSTFLYNHNASDFVVTQLSACSPDHATLKYQARAIRCMFVAFALQLEVDVRSSRIEDVVSLARCSNFSRVQKSPSGKDERMVVTYHFKRLFQLLISLGRRGLRRVGIGSFRFDLELSRRSANSERTDSVQKVRLNFIRTNGGRTNWQKPSLHV